LNFQSKIRSNHFSRASQIPLNLSHIFPKNDICFSTHSIVHAVANASVHFEACKSTHCFWTSSSRVCLCASELHITSALFPVFLASIIAGFGLFIVAILLNSI
jgi:hypothetical protein